MISAGSYTDCTSVWNAGLLSHPQQTVLALWVDPITGLRHLLMSLRESLCNLAETWGLQLLAAAGTRNKILWLK